MAVSAEASYNITRHNNNKKVMKKSKLPFMPTRASMCGVPDRPGGCTKVAV